MAMTELGGKRVAILAASGVEQVELVQPRDAVTEAGATTDLLSIATGEIQATNGDIYPGDTFPVDRAVVDASPEEYDGLILPGGVANPDTLRTHPPAVSFVQTLFGAGTPVGVICHGPWLLVEADLVRGRTLTSYVSIRTDIRNAGGDVVDQAVVTDQGLVSSRGPDDLDVFCRQIVEELAQGPRPVASAGATG